LNYAAKIFKPALSEQCFYLFSDKLSFSLTSEGLVGSSHYFAHVFYRSGA